MENQAKKQWQQPSIESLNINKTELGFGTTIFDYVLVGGKVVDIDLYDS